MCKNLILRYRCTHTHRTTLSPCRRTKTVIKRRTGLLQIMCKITKTPSLIPQLNMSSVCPMCYVHRNLYQRVNELFDLRLVWQRYGFPRARRDAERKRREVEEMERMLEGMEREGVRVREMGVRPGGRIGGSPLRNEVRVEDLVGEGDVEEEDEEENKAEKEDEKNIVEQEDDKDETQRNDSILPMSWEAAMARLALFGWDWVSVFVPAEQTESESRREAREAGDDDDGVGFFSCYGY